MKLHLFYCKKWHLWRQNTTVLRVYKLYVAIYWTRIYLGLMYVLRANTKVILSSLKAPPLWINLYPIYFFSIHLIKRISFNNLVKLRVNHKRWDCKDDPKLYYVTLSWSLIFGFCIFCIEYFNEFLMINQF